MSKLPEGRKPLTKEWFKNKLWRIDPTNNDDIWPLVDEMDRIRPFDVEEINRAKEREKKNGNS